jgi:hypothetical protein
MARQIPQLGEPAAARVPPIPLRAGRGKQPKGRLADAAASLARPNALFSGVETLLG